MADLDGVTASGDRAIVQRDAFERIQALRQRCQTKQPMSVYASGFHVLAKNETRNEL